MVRVQKFDTPARAILKSGRTGRVTGTIGPNLIFESDERFKGGLFSPEDFSQIQTTSEVQRKDIQAKIETAQLSRRVFSKPIKKRISRKTKRFDPVTKKIITEKSRFGGEVVPGQRKTFIKTQPGLDVAFSEAKQITQPSTTTVTRLDVKPPGKKAIDVIGEQPQPIETQPLGTITGTIKGTKTVDIRKRNKGIELLEAPADQFGAELVQQRKEIGIRLETGKASLKEGIGFGIIGTALVGKRVAENIINIPGGVVQTAVDPIGTAKDIFPGLKRSFGTDPAIGIADVLTIAGLSKIPIRGRGLISKTRAKARSGLDFGISTFGKGLKKTGRKLENIPGGPGFLDFTTALQQTGGRIIQSIPGDTKILFQKGVPRGLITELPKSSEIILTPKQKNIFVTGGIFESIIETSQKKGTPLNVRTAVSTSEIFTVTGKSTIPTTEVLRLSKKPIKIMSGKELLPEGGGQFIVKQQRAFRINTIESVSEKPPKISKSIRFSTVEQFGQINAQAFSGTKLVGAGKSVLKRREFTPIGESFSPKPLDFSGRGGSKTFGDFLGSFEQIKVGGGKTPAAAGDIISIGNLFFDRPVKQARRIKGQPIKTTGFFERGPQAIRFDKAIGGIDLTLGPSRGAIKLISGQQRAGGFAGFGLGGLEINQAGISAGRGRDSFFNIAPLKIIQKTRGRVSQRVGASARISQGIGLTGSFGIIQSPFQLTGKASKLLQQQRQPQRQIQSQTPLLDFRFGTSLKQGRGGQPSNLFAPVKPIAPFLPLLAFGDEDDKKKKKKKRRKGAIRKTRFTPQFAAFALDIFGKQPDTLTGLEFRPKTRRRKTRKRRK